ncbi:MAG TPA: ATP-binding cassette domain-containing protein [Woeseiaceae bacterium]|nr:ATP-binding cassette domain-containing protein [Woeseiaceae bacterium]
MIRVENLSKNYGTVKAVRSISFDLTGGQVVGFLGANGAGKSTTLKIMTGYISPSSGNVFYNDRSIQENTSEIQRDIGYLPELNPLYSEMRVHDYLKFISEIRGIPSENFKSSFQKVVEECALNAVAHRTIGNCSKGYKQRIGLAAAMIHDPKILILDEPVTGLDPNQIVEIRQLIRKLGKEKIVLMSSHILQEIQATVDRIIIINEGSIVADGSSDSLLSDSNAKTELNMDVENAEENDIRDMKATIPSVEINSISKEKSFTKISIKYPKNNDPRADIFKYAVEKEWTILEMVATKQNLEDIFRNLTNTSENNK